MPGAWIDAIEPGQSGQGVKQFLKFGFAKLPDGLPADGVAVRICLQ